MRKNMKSLISSHLEDCIIDRFHLSQLVTRSLNQTRIKLMNRYDTSNSEDKKIYRKLKAYWKLLLKNKTDLSDFDYRYHRLFNGQKSSRGIIDYFMTLDVEFKETYELAQQLLIALQHKNFPAYQSLIQTKKPFVSSQLKRSLKILNKHLLAIENSFKYKDSNGHLGGINNKIKVIKRISFGYRNFSNFRNRILLGFNHKRIAPNS
ncbi:transposase [Brochothrix campestris]|uniref:transposase n=2 Tax=Brochothrix campestris TaxID=2757 RepID=UPI0038CF6EE1